MNNIQSLPIFPTKNEARHFPRKQDIKKSDKHTNERGKIYPKIG